MMKGSPRMIRKAFEGRNAMMRIRMTVIMAIAVRSVSGFVLKRPPVEWLPSTVTLVKTII